ncbi:MAG: hypothetical protein F4Z52_00460 [Gammaproteobacteria bacterium]|nr:hypothetical protein [Gammaproteobacteria bacterium]
MGNGTGEQGLASTIEELNPLLGGWATYFRPDGAWTGLLALDG